MFRGPTAEGSGTWRPDDADDAGPAGVADVARVRAASVLLGPRLFYNVSGKAGAAWRRVVERRYVGLFEKLGSKVIGRSERMISPVPTPEDPQAVCAPVSGRVVALSDVADPVFSQGMLGVGVAIKPVGDVAFSPVAGTVIAEVKSRHALLIKAQSGAEVLLHVGLDSVTLGGAGFRQLVRKGDEVGAGVPLLRFDRVLMAERGLDDTVVVTVTNPDSFERVEPVCPGDEVRAGAVVLRVA